MGAGRRSAWLGLAQALELGLQILLPVLLVRHLSATGFADYRRAWLIAGTAASLLPFAMPDALSLILPRASAIERGAHVRLVFTYLAVIGASAGFCTFWALSMAGAQTAPFARAALIGLFAQTDLSVKLVAEAVRPEQIAEIGNRHPELGRLRLVVTRESETDAMTLSAEIATPADALRDAVASTLRAVTKLSGNVTFVSPGSLPNDGKAISDERKND